MARRCPRRCAWCRCYPADADLDRVGAGFDQRFGRFGGGDVAGDDLTSGNACASPPRLRSPRASVRGRCRSRARRHRLRPARRARLPVRGGANRGADAQAPAFVLTANGFRSACSKSLIVMSHQAAVSTTRSFSIRCLWSSSRASSGLTPEVTVTSLVVISVLTAVEVFSKRCRARSGCRPDFRPRLRHARDVVLSHHAERLSQRL